MTEKLNPRDSATLARAPQANALDFVVANSRFLAFGFLLTFFSSFGQTFYIGLFGAELRTAFALSHGGFGAIYTIGSLGSALAIIWTGPIIDRLELRIYACLVCAGFIAAHFIMALAPTVLFLVVAIFMLRHAGQGLMIHTAQSSMARYFDKNRGRAVSVTGLGLAVGEAVFPLTGVMLIATFGWRDAWLVTGVVLGIGLIPLNLWLLRGHAVRHAAHLAAQQVATGAGLGTMRRQWSRGEVMRDPNFYLILVVFLAATFVITGFFFHQGAVAVAKGWDLKLIAQAFVGYSIVKVPATLIIGQAVDRVGARKLVPFLLLPLGCAMIVVAVLDYRWAAFAYLALAGLTTGGALTLMSAVWAEIYGVTHIGAVRSLVMSSWVAASAVSTWLLGALLDLGLSVQSLAWAAAVLIVLASSSAAVGVRRAA